MTQAKKGRQSTKPFMPNVSTTRATLEESEHPALVAFAEWGEWSSVQNKDLDVLASGTEWPIHTYFGMANTTRATSSTPNVQNQRRDKPGRPSVRECFVARPGRCLIAIDHTGLELSTLAQCCIWLLGAHRMADRINAGEDEHSHIGCAILHMTYADFRAALKGEQKYVAKNARNNGKVVNFGCPGGMGWRTLRLYAKQNYGISLTDAEAQHLVQLWRRTNPDGMAFLEYVQSLRRPDGLYDVVIPGTSILRRGCSYNAACNTHFQGLGAVIEGHIAWLISREIHLGVTPAGAPSPLRWAHPWNFVHDEHIVEVPIEARTEVYHRLGEIMSDGARRYMPDVQCGSEAVCMTRWSKRAENKFINGEIDIWDS